MIEIICISGSLHSLIESIYRIKDSSSHHILQDDRDTSLHWEYKMFFLLHRFGCASKSCMSNYYYIGILDKQKSRHRRDAHKVNSKHLDMHPSAACLGLQGPKIEIQILWFRKIIEPLCGMGINDSLHPLIKSLQRIKYSTSDHNLHQDRDPSPHWVFQILLCLLKFCCASKCCLSYYYTISS